MSYIAPNHMLAFGVGQKRHDVTALRAANVAYHNNSLQPRMVYFEAGYNRYFEVSQDNVTWTRLPLVNAHQPGVFIVQPLEFYRISGSFISWWEYF